MKYVPSILRSGLAVAVLALLPITELAAQVWNPPAATPRSCTVQVQGGSVAIIAGYNGDPLAEFPIAVTSITDGFCTSGTCLRWDYQFRYSGINPSLALVSADSNLRVLAAPDGSLIVPVSATNPISFDNSINFGNVGGELGIRYSANSNTYDARFYTDTTAIVGTVTAGFKSGNRNGFCAIAGANKPSSGNTDLSVPKQLVTTSLGCEVKWTQSADGCVTGATVTQGICTVTQANNTNKQPLQALHAISKIASCATEINVPGSENICRYNTFLRTYTCVTVN